MATLEQFADLANFAANLPEAERTALSVDEIYDRWRAERDFHVEVEALREALEDYQRGERGRPADEVIADLDRIIRDARAR